MALEEASSVINARRCVLKLISSLLKTNKYKSSVDNLGHFDDYLLHFFSMGTLVVTVRQAQNWTDATVAEVLPTLPGILNNPQCPHCKVTSLLLNER